MYYDSHYHVYYKTRSGKLESSNPYRFRERAEEVKEQLRKATIKNRDTSLRARSFHVGECSSDNCGLVI